MKKLLKIFVLSIALISCKEALKSKVENNKVTTKYFSNNQLKKEVKSILQNNKQTIEEFLEQLKTVVRNNDTNSIQNYISFPFEHKSGGELVDSYNSYNEIKVNSELFNKIEKAKYIKDCDDEIEKIKHYCISYFDDTLDVTFYAVKRNNQFRLIRMETPN